MFHHEVITVRLPQYGTVIFYRVRRILRKPGLTRRAHQYESYCMIYIISYKLYNLHEIALKQIPFSSNIRLFFVTEYSVNVTKLVTIMSLVTEKCHHMILFDTFSFSFCKLNGHFDTVEFKSVGLSLGISGTFIIFHFNICESTWLPSFKIH